MRAYLAAPYAARTQIRTLASQLTRIGYTITSTWLDEEHEVNAGTTGAASSLADNVVMGHALQDLKDIDRSQLLVLFTLDVCDLEDGGSGISGGRHVETGYAIARNVPIVVVGEPENVFHRMGKQVTVVPNWHEALIELSARLVAAERDYPRAVEG